RHVFGLDAWHLHQVQPAGEQATIGRPEPGEDASHGGGAIWRGLLGAVLQAAFLLRTRTTGVDDGLLPGDELPNLLPPFRTRRVNPWQPRLSSPVRSGGPAAHRLRPGRGSRR